MSSDNMRVYVIIDEWLPSGGAYELTEIVGGRWFDSQDSAWDHLFLVAESYDVELHSWNTSFYMNEPEPGISHQSYYIEELVNE